MLYSRWRVCDVVVDCPALEEGRVVRAVGRGDDQRVLQHVVVRRRVNLLSQEVGGLSLGDPFIVFILVLRLKGQ